MYGFLISISSIFSLLIAEKMLPKKIKKDDFWTLSLFLLFFSILGGRLYHVIDFWSYYSQNPLNILYLNQGGLGIFGALFFGFAVLFLFSKIKKIPFLLLSDLYLSWAFLVQAFGRFGNWFNKELFGLPTNTLFKIYIPYENRPKNFKEFSYFHPLFFYEAFLDFLAFAFFVFLYKKHKISLGRGIYTSLYLILYGFFRILLEQFRFSSDTFEFLNIRISYLISSGFILIGLLLLKRTLSYHSKV